MLDYVRASASPRKLRLLACACCRRVWEVMKNRDSRKAVAVAERFADSQAADAERAEARRRTNIILAKDR
jgi:hypothetical protein